MFHKRTPLSGLSLVVTVVLLVFPVCLAVEHGTTEYPQPPVWPEQFHAVCFQNRSGNLALVDLWYDWPAQRNLNLIHKQQGSTLWDIEYGNRTSYYFDREANTCRTVKFPVGLLTPDWLKDSEYAGQQAVDNHDCHVWKKGAGNFITYFADVNTGRPVQWIFGWDGAVFQIMTWEEGAVLPDEEWQAPEACFDEDQPAPADSQDSRLSDVLQQRGLHTAS